ncbi:putative UDP-glucose flavonoid 3-O-glucosyltransferase 3 [Capsicum annuum]|uniref:anthocyanidin 3-O-glucosyltransferase 2 n=1 Tax=Capsicum annuum TaxID=4072 RepID=UPI001FB0E97E|nr:anthocyanidin 3-O-glucosyltransferase 2 [Capsicum annuum]KAF3671664.1 putative UDP-glucose flavonoid 3-O-glucosyltransferase 3 [Capsicum annuum]
MTRKAHLVFIPSPGAGHLISAVEIAKLILNRDERLCISVLIMKLPMDFGIQSYIESLSSTPRLQFVDITVDDETAAVFLSNEETFFMNFIQAHKPKVRDLLTNSSFSRSNYRLAGFVLDMFCTSMKDVANEFNIPTYIFFTSSAGFLALCFHFESLKKEHHIDTSKYRDSDEELAIPGFKNPYPAKLLPRLATDQTVVTTMFFDLFTRFKETKGIIVNTFAELEPFALQSLSAPQIYPVGPAVNLKEEGHVRNSQSETESIKKWLDEQPESSVVFLCFGSMGSFDTQQIKEIAVALECSGHRFLWSLRRPPPKGKLELPSNYEDFQQVLPQGFIERTNGVGKVIGWAPQVAILSHPAVGGFVSHCGWNSVLESLCFGVPIAAWPMYAEQQLNAFELVQELELTVEIRMDYFKDFHGKDEHVDIVGAKEIESGIRQLMAGGDENEIRIKAKEMKEKSSAAMKEGGSSYASLGLLIKDVISNIS